MISSIQYFIFKIYFHSIIIVLACSLINNSAILIYFCRSPNQNKNLADINKLNVDELVWSSQVFIFIKFLYANTRKSSLVSSIWMKLWFRKQETIPWIQLYDKYFISNRKPVMKEFQIFYLRKIIRNFIFGSFKPYQNLS